jgi:tryptophan synthase alpha subunit
LTFAVKDIAKEIPQILQESFEIYTTDNIKNVKRILGSDIPLAVGFGINTPSQATYD